MFNDVFLSILPNLDLHGNTSDMVYVLINDFLNENYKLNNYKVVIIHGKGEGILKNATHEILKKDKRVKSFYLDSFNTGCTIVEMKEHM